MDIISDLEKRGLLDNCSNKENLLKLLNSKQTIYCGFDPSASSLQLGNFIMITLLQRFQKAGHKVIALIGGATGMIGDPSGKKAERQFLSEKQVIKNAEAIKKQLSKYIDCSDPNKGEILTNYDWWKKINTISFLRDYGKNFQIGYMLAKDIVKSRLEVGISYAEFSYMILQSGDFAYLYENKNCKIQIGGGDQWGNLTSSLDFVKKKQGKDDCAEVFSIKLITDSQGKKFGKSESGALYLDPKLTTPYKIYQYFMNVSDQDVKKYLYIFDDRNTDELDKIYVNHMEHPELRNGQQELAKMIVTKLHGKEEADKCIEMSKALFNDDFSNLNKGELLDLTDGIELLKIKSEISLLDALTQLHLAQSKREAREFVSNNAIKINGVKCNDIDKTISIKDSLDGGFIFIKRGKKNYATLQFIK